MSPMRIFVSSTFEDLREHRTAVDHILQRLEQQYQGMEFFGSRPDTPLVESLRAAAGAEVFIGIDAYRSERC